MTQEPKDESILLAGRYAGKFLDRIGIYDLSKLTKDQYYDFCSIIAYEFFESYLQEPMNHS